MAATITRFPQAEAIARRLIPAFHSHLENATILFLATDAKRTKNKKVVLGTAKKTSPMEHFLSQRDDREGADFVLLFGLEEWYKLTEEQRVALIDHELAHCTVEYDDETDEPSWAIRAHDVEEFAEIIERHGLWQPDLQRMAVAIEQLRLPLAAEVAS